ncbi:hypothetical protein C8Q75DRAFT_779621 [Abortiporus biennis]|nr:hypothetical protein C8Q75DRAFT_779621 [Abortiporus biennis]
MMFSNKSLFKILFLSSVLVGFVSTAPVPSQDDHSNMVSRREYYHLKPRHNPSSLPESDLSKRTWDNSQHHSIGNPHLHDPSSSSTTSAEISALHSFLAHDHNLSPETLHSIASTPYTPIEGLTFTNRKLDITNLGQFAIWLSKLEAHKPPPGSPPVTRERRTKIHKLFVEHLEELARNHSGGLGSGHGEVDYSMHTPVAFPHPGLSYSPHYADHNNHNLGYPTHSFAGSYQGSGELHSHDSHSAGYAPSYAPPHGPPPHLYAY